MTRTQISDMMASIGLPYAYDHFTPTEENPMPAPPFMCFRLDADYVYADDKPFIGVPTLSIELYADNRDYTQEAEVELMLTTNELSWEKEETYLDGERLYMTTWTCSVVLTEGE